MRNEFEESLELRKSILKASLLIEQSTSNFICRLLSINQDNSKLFGNTSGCLSFNQKIDLLIEIGALDKDTRTKYQIFMEIRNQFMHNYKANTYSECLKNLNGRKSYLLKTYNFSETPLPEKQIEMAISKLIIDVLGVTQKIIEKVKENATKTAESIVYKDSNTALLYSLKHFEFKGLQFDEKISKGITNKILNEFVNFWKEKFDDLQNNKCSS